MSKILSTAAWADMMPTPTSSYLPASQSTSNTVSLKANTLVKTVAITANTFSSTTPNSNSSTVVVLGTSGPWEEGANPGYTYGTHDESGPTIFPVTAGESLTLTYVSGTVSAGLGWPYEDAEGNTNVLADNIRGSSGQIFPSFYMSPYPIFLDELVGVFADASGVIVGSPFSIGVGPTKVTAPAGATQLELGVNDDIYHDNVGAFTVQITESSTYSLSVTVGGQSGANFPISPTILAHPESGCSSANIIHNSLPVSIRCIDQSTGTDYQGPTPCQYKAQLALGSNNGGHDHTSGARPLACTPSQCSELSHVIKDGDTDIIEEDGSTVLTYAASELSGEVVLTLTGIDPNNNPIPSQNVTFNVQAPGSESWEALSNNYINVIINGADSTLGGPSHPQGYYGTPSMFFAVELMGADFTQNLFLSSSVPILKSQAASLPQGGLYDIKENWTTPHCGHRDGMTIDLSLSTLTAEQKAALADAAASAGMTFFYAPFYETPFDLSANHWHATLNQ